MRTLACACLALIACDGWVSKMPETIYETADRVVRPRSVTSSSLPISTFATPQPWQQLYVADEANSTLLGSERGLVELSVQGSLVSRSADPVLGLVALTDGSALIANASGFFEWRDGTLRRSNIESALSSGDRLLARRGDVIWFARGTALLRFDGTGLEAIELGQPIDTLTLGAGSLATVRAGSKFWALTERADGFELQDLTEELSDLIDAMPWGAGSEVTAVSDGGVLWRRAEVDGGWAWRHVALTTDLEDPGATSVRALAVDAHSGAVFATTDSTLYRLQGESVTTLALPTPLRSTHAGRNGVLWALTSTGAVRIGNTDPVTFEPRIATLATVHCARCHAPDRQASFLPLLTIDDWRAQIDAAILASTPMGATRARMPADTTSTLTDEERALLIRWKEDGLQ